MRVLRLAVMLALTGTFLAANLYAADLEKLEQRLMNCDEVLKEIMQMPDKSIPTDLLSKCAGVAIFPYVVKGGFFVGARYGKGVVVAHNPRTGAWEAPAFFTIGGGSFGFQFGAQAVDLKQNIKTIKLKTDLSQKELNCVVGIHSPFGFSSRPVELDSTGTVALDLSQLPEDAKSLILMLSNPTDQTVGYKIVLN